MTEREAQAEALKSAANDLPAWAPGRERIATWLWERAARLESLPDCTCGFGGEHLDNNPRCAANAHA